MRFFCLVLLIGITLQGFEGVSYKCYGDSYLVEQGHVMERSGKVANNTKITVKGNGKVSFFYPCGAPSIIKVNGSTEFTPKHNCKDTSIAESLVANFLDKWFKQDERIIISASSRSAIQVSRGNNYFFIDEDHLKSIDIPIYDIDAEYKLIVNSETLDVKNMLNTAFIKIPVSLLSDRSKNHIILYEDDIKVFDFTIEYISQADLRKKYSDKSLSVLETALLYEKDSNTTLYINSKIDYLLQGAKQ